MKIGTTLSKVETVVMVVMVVIVAREPLFVINFTVFKSLKTLI